MGWHARKISAGFCTVLHDHRNAPVDRLHEDWRTVDDMALWEFARYQDRVSRRLQVVTFTGGVILQRVRAHALMHIGLPVEFLTVLWQQDFPTCRITEISTAELLQT
jgi:hypothetical protein